MTPTQKRRSPADTDALNTALAEFERSELDLIEESDRRRLRLINKLPTRIREGLLRDPEVSALRRRFEDPRITQMAERVEPRGPLSVSKQGRTPEVRGTMLQEKAQGISSSLNANVTLEDSESEWEDEDLPLPSTPQPNSVSSKVDQQHRGKAPQSNAKMEVILPVRGEVVKAKMVELAQTNDQIKLFQDELTRLDKIIPGMKPQMSINDNPVQDEVETRAKDKAPHTSIRINPFIKSADSDVPHINAKVKPAQGKGKVKEVVSNAEKEISRYVRIGTQKCTKAAVGEIQHEVIVVAEVPTPGGKGHVDVAFLAVDAWALNGVQLGHCEDSYEIDINDETTVWKPDQYFMHSSKQLIINKVTDIMGGKVGIHYHSPLLSQHKSKSNTLGINLIHAPTKPTYAAYGTQPKGLRKPKSRSKIVGVVYFNNQSNREDLDLPINLQASLTFTESYASFLSWVLDGDDGLVAKLPDVVGGFQVEVWVLPQIQGGLEMFCWTRMKEWTMWQWLDDGAWEEYGWTMVYLEVRILSNDAGSTGDVVKIKRAGEGEGEGGPTKKQQKKKTVQWAPGVKVA